MRRWIPKVDMEYGDVDGIVILCLRGSFKDGLMTG